ncbi:MAG TPA: hypothetical protein VF773_01100 [Verrucomicrobiae bacterium]
MKFSSGIVPGSKTRRIMIKCPKTGEVVNTGLAMDSEAFHAVTLAYELKCSACSGIHNWTNADAFPGEVQ